MRDKAGITAVVCKSDQNGKRIWFARLQIEELNPGTFKKRGEWRELVGPLSTRGGNSRERRYCDWLPSCVAPCQAPLLNFAFFASPLVGCRKMSGVPEFLLGALKNKNEETKLLFIRFFLCREERTPCWVSGGMCIAGLSSYVRPHQGLHDRVSYCRGWTAELS